MAKTFIKNKEDFTCEQCGFFVQGSGYTNHCPQCLWSKHVDVYPGDRKSLCGGAMKPVSIEMQKDLFIVTHECVICGHCKPNKTNSRDDVGTWLSKNKKQ